MSFLKALIRMQEQATVVNMPVDFILGDHAFRRLLVEVSPPGVVQHVFNGTCVDEDVPGVLKLCGPMGNFNVHRAPKGER